MEIVLALVALIWAFPAVAMLGQSDSTPGKDPGSSLDSLLEQSSKLEAENSRLAAEKNDLLKEDGNLQQQDSDLKARAKQLQNKKLEFKMDADALQQDIGQYNAQCGGSHPRSVYESLRPKCEPWGVRAYEKSIKDPDDVFIEAEERRRGSARRQRPDHDNKLAFVTVPIPPRILEK